MTFETGTIIRERTDVPNRPGVSASPVPLRYRVEKDGLTALRENGTEGPAALYTLDDVCPSRFERVTDVE